MVRFSSPFHRIQLTSFLSEFNHRRNDAGDCVLVTGYTPLPNDDTCRADDEEFWYERTPYRKVPISSCEGGERLDRGPEHRCPGLRGHSMLFWLFVLVLPFGFTALVAYWYYRRSGLATGTIRLPGGGFERGRSSGDGGVVDTLASVPWFLLGVAGVAWEWATSHVEALTARFRPRRGYRHVPVDEDAQILRFEDEE